MHGWTPTKAITVIAGTPPGGGQDRVGHAVKAALGELGFEAVVRNISGRGGGNGWDALAAEAEPHQVAVSSPTLITNRLLGAGDIDHNALTTLPLLCTEYTAFVVASSAVVRSPLELFDHAHSGEGAPVVAFATALGNINHIALGMVTRRRDIDQQQLSLRVFDSARHAVDDVLAGNADLAVVSAASAVPEIQLGALKAVAVSAPQRISQPYEDVPTWEELGVPGSIGTWRGLVGAPALTAGHVAFWDATAAAMVATASWRRALEQHRWVPTFLDSAAAKQMFIDQQGELTAVLDELGLIHARS